MSNTAANMPRMTAAEYLRSTAETEKPTELLNGEVVMMASPSTEHQRLVREITYELETYIRKKGGSCEVFHAPYDVILNDENVVQPDVLVVCDPEKIGKQNCSGAPDFVVEITSSDWQTDYRDKLMLYRAAGVREYWIVDTQMKKVLAYRFAQEPNVLSLYEWTECVPVGIYGGDISICIHDLL